MDFDTPEFFLNLKDYSVSHEDFNLYRNGELDLLTTMPKPDPSELSRYYESDDYISHTDAKRSIFERAYHFVKEIALKNKVSLINRLSPSKGKLLDIGAGTGDFLFAARENGWVVSGAEPSAKANAIAAGKGLELSFDTKKLSDHSFDVISMWHVLEHVYDPAEQISELKRLLRPGGTIIVAVPNFKSFDAQHYREFWAAYDVPRHLWHFSKTSIKTLFEQQGFSLSEIIPMKFDAYYVSLLSEKYKSGSMNYVKAAWVGVKSNLYGRKTGEYSSHIYIIKG